jgi:hypothetical protein
VSAETYQKVMDQFDKTEISLFNDAFFTTEIEKNSCIIYFTPGKKEIDDLAFFTYDAKADSITINEGLPGSVSFVNNGIGNIRTAKEADLTADDNLRRLTISPAATDSNVNTNLGKLESNGSEGLRYNIPKQCIVSVRKNKKPPTVMVSMALPQWGTLANLNAKMSKVSVVVNPETGALLSVNMESKGLSAEQVKNALAAAEKTRDLFIRDKDAEAVTKMEKKIKQLETKDKLDKLEAGEPEELIALKREVALLTEQKNMAELKKAIKDLEKED